MQLRDHEAITTKRDFFMVDPRLLKTEDGYNVRDLSTPEAIAKLDELEISIIANGVRVPLEIRLDGEDLYITAGHRRHIAVMNAIAKGHEIKAIPVMPEPSRRNSEDRVLDLITSNSGEPLQPLEIAEVVRRLLNFGWTDTQIATRCGWKSTNTVKRYSDMLAMPTEVKTQIKNGDVSATLAAKLTKEDPDKVAELIRLNKQENARIRGKDKRHKVTAKTIKRDREKAKPKQVEVKHDEQPLAVVATTAAPLRDVSQGGGEPMGSPQECDRDSAPVAELGAAHLNPLLPSALAATSESEHPQATPIPISRGIHGSVAILVEAIIPFAKIVDDIDPDCPNDTVIFISDHVGNIDAGQLRGAFRAWKAVTGGEDNVENEPTAAILERLRP